MVWCGLVKILKLNSTQSVSESVTKVGIELLGQLKNSHVEFLFFHIYQVEIFFHMTICHVEIFSTGIACGVCDKYEVLLKGTRQLFLVSCTRFSQRVSH